MFDAYAFSGPRKLTKQQEDVVYNYLDRSFNPSIISPILVGDADGLDRIIRLHYECKVFEVKGSKPSDFANRTITMLRELRLYPKPCLIAFPNKPCPVGCTPGKFTGKGSGTWLAIATAKFLCMPIEIVKLDDFDLPRWIFEYQLSLF